MPRVALYSRVSTTDQRPEVQLEPLRAYATARGLEVAGEYVDHGISGAKARRPALDRLLADARRRRFDVVACVKLDRLARSMRHLTALAGELEALGVDLVVLDQGIDTTTPTGRLLFNVLGAIAEFERDLIRERVTAGLRSAKRRGVRIGRPRALDAERSERLVDLFEEGASLRAISRALGVGNGTVADEVRRLGLRRAG